MAQNLTVTLPSSSIQYCIRRVSIQRKLRQVFILIPLGLYQMALWRDFRLNTYLGD